MGGFLKGAITGQNSDGSDLSAGQGIVGGLMKGSAMGMGSALQPSGQSSGGGGVILQPGPGPAPVDSSYFAPTQFNRNNPIYGR